VSIGLSAAELTQLQAALELLLSPLDCDGVAAWRSKARHAVQALLGADSSVSILQIPGEPAFEADDVQPLVDYGLHYHRFDRVNKYHDLGTIAFTWDVIGHLWERPSRTAWLKSEFYNDWVSKNRLCQPRGLNVALPPGQPLLGPPPGEDVAALYLYQDRERPQIDRDHQLSLLRTLLPAFSAGAYIALRLGVRGALDPLIGALTEGVAVLDRRLQVIYQNAAMCELLADDPERTPIEQACLQLGHAVLAAGRGNAKSRVQELVGPGPRAVRTATGGYCLRGALVASGALGVGPAAVVVVERTTPGRRRLDALRSRFGLTPRELLVSGLLTEGRSNHEVAHALGVSIHTARRHVEHVLLKLGVHSRAAVGAKLRDSA